MTRAVILTRFILHDIKITVDDAKMTSPHREMIIITFTQHYFVPK